jgi:hypothetical protein
MYSGVSGSTNYRSKIKISIGDYLIKSSRLVVALTIDTQSSPAGTYAVLSADDSFTPKAVTSSETYSSNTHKPSAELLATAIAESYPHEDAEGTKVHTGSNKQNGFTFYYVFDTDQLQPNTDYYVYVMRNIYSACGTTSGYTRAPVGKIVITLDYEGVPLSQSMCTLNGQKGRGGTSYGTNSVYMGYGNGTTHYESGFSFTTGDFTGISKSVTFKLKMSHNGLGTTSRVYRWALLSSDANAKGTSTVTNYYYNTANDVTDENQIAQGTVEWLNLNLDTHKTLTIKTAALKPNTTYYLMLWPSTVNPTSFITISALQYHDKVYVDYSAGYIVSVEHKIQDEDGVVTQFHSESYSVLMGDSFTPTTVEAPEGYVDSNATYKAWDTNWGLMFEGMANIDAFTVDQNMYVAIYYLPILKGSFIYFNYHNNHVVKCEVYANQYGQAVRRDVYYNDHGVAVKT